MYDAVVIGAGAAGLMAAGEVAYNGGTVLLIEKMEKVGRKVRISGKGRCNITNLCPREEFISKIRNGSEFFTPAFRGFDNKRTCRFFEKMGVRTIEEQGHRVFPKSGKAWDVADALLYWCRDNNVEIMLNTRVENILTVAGKIYAVSYVNKRGFRRQVEAKNVILTTGGAAYPSTGSTGDGYEFAHRLGHTIVPIRPSLVPLETNLTDSDMLRGLQLRNIAAELVVNGKVTSSEFGEIAFSERGIEGAVVLRMSLEAVDALSEGNSVTLKLDLKPALTPEILSARIDRELADLPEDAFWSDLLRKLVPRELVGFIARKMGIGPKTFISKITKENLATLIDMLKCMLIPISGYRPFSEAIVTAGGVDLSEVDPETLQSRKVEGLYFAGELLDIDGNTGGYNLQIAFSTGFLAGQLKK